MASIRRLGTMMKGIRHEKTIAEGNEVAVFYVLDTALGSAPVADWYAVRDGKIASIHGHFRHSCCAVFVTFSCEAEWCRSLGQALVDPGAPFIGTVTVSEDRIENGAIGPNASGHNFVQAESLAAAAEVARGCPLLKHGRRINVVEILGQIA